MKDDGEVKTIGWSAIDAALEPIYHAAQPKHFGTYIRYRLGGPDPLDGIIAYPRSEPIPHWHFVTYGFTELYDEDSENPDVNGWGFDRYGVTR